MNKLGITPSLPKLGSFANWIDGIPAFFIGLCLFIVLITQAFEAKVEKKEYELRMQREGASVNLQKYFKKSQDKFDKLEYLSDLYKLIRENLDEINQQIAENDRRT